MAATTEIQQRVLLTLHTAELMVNDLPEVADEWGEIEWGEAATDEQLSWSMDWGNEMAGLARLGRWAADGVLSPEQEARYRALLRQLREYLPLIERLNLRRPPVVLDA
jgi:hypothetical protein